MGIFNVRLILAAALVATVACERTKEKSPDISQLPPQGEPTQPAPQDERVPDESAPAEPATVQPTATAPAGETLAPAKAVSPQLLLERDAAVESMNARILFLYEHHNWQIVILPKNPAKVRPTIAEYPWYQLQPPSIERIRKELKQQIAEAEGLKMLAAEGVAVSGLDVIDTTIEFSKLYLESLEADAASRNAEAGGAATHGG